MTYKQKLTFKPLIKKKEFYKKHNKKAKIFIIFNIKHSFV